MKTVVKYMGLIMMFLGVLSCCRQTLEDMCGSQVTVPISIDWSESNLDLSVVDDISIYIYPKDGSNPYVVISNDIDSTNISISAGEYSALIFSGVVGNVTGVRFIDPDIYSEFSVEAKADTSTSLYYQVLSGEALLSQLEGFAAWRLDDLYVEGDTTTCCCSSVWGGGCSDQLLDVIPTPVTATITTTMRVENLNSASYIEGVLSGFSRGANLSTNSRLVSEDDLYMLDFQNRVYDDSSNPIDGSIVCSILSFGKQPVDSATYQLELNVILASGEKLTYQRDITSQVEESDDFNIEINLSDSSSMIYLPESSASGFGVESWGSSEQVELL